MLAILAGNHGHPRRVNVLGRGYLTGRFSGVHDWPVLGVHRGSEIVIYLTYAVLGSSGLIILRLGITVGLIVLIYAYLRYRGIEVISAGFVSLLIYPVMSIGVGGMRTHLFTYVMFAILLLIIATAERGSNVFWVTPALFALWANLHPGFLAGLAVFAAWALTHTALFIVGRDRMTRGRIGAGVVVLGLSLAATVLTPFGTELWRLLFQGPTFVRPEISEWVPIRIMSADGIVYLLTAAVFLLGIVFDRRGPGAAIVVVLIGVGLAPLTALRHLPLLGLACGILAGEHLGTVYRTPFRLRYPFAVATVSLLVSVVLLGDFPSRVQCLSFNTLPRFYPVRAFDLLKRSAIEANLAVHFDWGMYAIWHLSPQIKVSLDGRRDTAYPHDVYSANNRFREGVGDWDAILRRRETDLALVSKAFPVFNLMKLYPRWTLVHEDSLSGLFARQGSALEATLRQTSRPPLPDDGAGLCFP
jgi:hypothetical protein